MTNLKLEIPEKLEYFLYPMRYKVALGGRGSAKSWTAARVALVKGVEKRMRFLCAREVQKSIKQSVHKLLKDQIENLGLQNFYTVYETEIKGKNGTEFAFTGLSDQTVDSIKSYEGCDVCWIEEGQAISKRSMDILTPTIRKEGSEIWVTMNPDLETDEMYIRFVTNKPENCITRIVNYYDNPWFNEVLEDERQRCEINCPDDYPNIWLGKCRPAAQGAIYYKEVESAQDNGRICNVPYDPMLRVHVVFDIGWNDAMAISLVQRNASEIRVIEYLEDSHKTIDHYSALLKERKYNWGSVWLPPTDGFSGDVKTGKSVADIMRNLGWEVPHREEVAQYGIEDGIRIARMTFPRVYFDRTKTARLIECLKRYRRMVNRQTDEPSKPLHDEYSHGADNFRYVCVNADLMKNAVDSTNFFDEQFTVSYSPIDSTVGY